MKKEEKAVRQLFQEDSAQDYICAEKKKQAIQQLMEASEIVIAKNSVSNSSSHSQQKLFCGEISNSLYRLRMQIKYMDKRQYYFQIAVILIVIAFAFPAREIEQMFLDSLLVYVTFSSILFSTIAVITCNIADKHGMAELTGSCYFNHMQMCVLRMVLSGGISLGATGVLLCTTYVYMDSPLWQIGIYILVPYFVTGCFQFALISVDELRNSPYVLWIGGLIMMVAFGAAVSEIQVYESFSIGVWVWVLVVSVVTMALELMVLFKRIERGDILVPV